MTREELDQIAAREERLWNDHWTAVYGIVLSPPERDALLTLAREGAREQAAQYARNAENDVKQAMELLDEANRMLTHCPTCGEFRGHGHVCATPPTSGPDGVR